MRDCKNVRLDSIPAAKTSHSTTTENSFGDEIFHPGSEHFRFKNYIICL